MRASGLPTTCALDCHSCERVVSVPLSVHLQHARAHAATADRQQTQQNSHARAVQTELESARSALTAEQAKARDLAAAADTLRGERGAAHTAELAAKRENDEARSAVRQLEAEVERTRSSLRQERADAKKEAARLRSQLECAPPACACVMQLKSALCTVMRLP